jgi:DnaJ-class molecular chaperone
LVTWKIDTGKGGVLGKRVNIDGPGDNPDEYWFECDDCAGTGKFNAPVGMNENIRQLMECPGCGGLGFIGGDEDDALIEGV